MLLIDFIFLRNRIVLLLHHNNNKNFKIMTTTLKEEIINVLKSKGYTVSVDTRVWILSTSGTWREVRSIEEANKL